MWNRKALDGAFNSMTTVYSSIAVTLSRFRARWRTTGLPAVRARATLSTTSSSVKSAPLWNLTPCLRWKV